MRWEHVPSGFLQKNIYSKVTSWGAGGQQGLGWRGCFPGGASPWLMKGLCHLPTLWVYEMQGWGRLRLPPPLTFRPSVRQESSCWCGDKAPRLCPAHLAPRAWGHLHDTPASLPGLVAAGGPSLGGLGGGCQVCLDPT